MRAGDLNPKSEEAEQVRTEDRVIGHRLRDVRTAAGISQSALAIRMGMHQAALSRLEQQDDILLSTLLGYVKNIGANLQMLAQLNDVLFPLAILDGNPNPIDLDWLGPSNLGDLDQSKRDVVFSIKPQHSERILAGQKTVELRRRFPRKVVPGGLAFIYTTTPVRALTGVATIEAVIERSPHQLWMEFSDQACVPRSHFRSYFAGLSTAFAIKLRGAKRLRRPIELAELRERFSFEPPQSFLYARPQLCKALHDECADLSDRHKRLHWA